MHNGIRESAEEEEGTKYAQIQIWRLKTIPNEE